MTLSEGNVEPRIPQPRFFAQFYVTPFDSQSAIFHQDFDLDSELRSLKVGVVVANQSSNYVNGIELPETGAARLHLPPFTPSLLINRRALFG